MHSLYIQLRLIKIISQYEISMNAILIQQYSIPMILKLTGGGRVVFAFGRVSDCLKVLQLQKPITKKQIKKRYIQLAKKYHPDSSSSKTNQQEMNKQFIQVTKAYKDLCSFPQQQINLPQDESPSPQSPSTDQTEQSMRRWKDEQLRRDSYQYFNRRSQTVSQTQEMPFTGKQKSSIFWSAPQFLIGIGFVIVAFAEWSYKAYVATVKQKQRTKSKDGLFEVYKSMNSKKKYQLRKELQDQLKSDQS